MNVKLAAVVLLSVVLLIEIGMMDAHRRWRRRRGGRRRCWGWRCHRRRRIVHTTTTTPATTSTSTPATTSTVSTTLSTTVVPPTASLLCNFEVGETCFLRQDTADNSDFTIFSGRTPTAFTGPLSAFNGSRYAYLEVSHRSQLQFAVLTSAGSVVLPSNTNYCLRLAYHMRGFLVGSLAVAAGGVGSPKAPLFSIAGSQGNVWRLAAVDVPASSTNLEVEIIAVKGIGPFGDIAVDYIQLIPGTCAVPLTTTTRFPIINN